MVTTELRRDPWTGGWVVIDREPRRDDFDPSPQADLLSGSAAGSCALCDGREGEAGQEILAWREGSAANLPGWALRVVPSPRPLLRIEADQMPASGDLYAWLDGLGAHEVVVETPRHGLALQALDRDAVWRVLWAWRTRMQDLKRDTRFEAMVAFKNHGWAAGARMAHAHSQVVAYPLVPPALDERVRAAAAHAAATTRCLACDIVERELQERVRLVVENADVVAAAPYASRAPFEVVIFPRSHAARFEEASDPLLRGVADALKDVLTRIDWALEGPAYNLVLHSAPFRAEAKGLFHWHLAVVPRVTRIGGLEWAGGIPRNPVSPERAAAALRAACDHR